MDDLMDVHFAIKNHEVNRAGDRAMAIIERMCAGQYSAELVELKRLRAGDIMQIFQDKPNAISSAYVALVFAFANKLEGSSRLES